MRNPFGEKKLVLFQNRYSPLLVPLSVSVALDRLPPLSPVHSIDGDLEASHAASSAPTLPTLSTKRAVAASRER